MSGESASVFPLGASVAGRRYLVYGLARSGLATVRALLAAGAQVVAWDEKAEAREAAAALSPLPLAGGVGGGPVDQAASPSDSPSPNPSRKREGLSFADPLTIDLTGFDGIVVSPGVPINTHPIAAAARAANVPLIGDIELFALARPSLPPHKVVGITGTNGKSTTTALVHHILKTAGVPVTMGGNIGIPILSQPALPEGGVYVLELSSYQIDLTHRLACDVAVLTNLTPDHLDRYDGDFMAYAASKARLFTLQHADQTAVIAADDDRTKMIASRVAHRLARVSAMDIDAVDQAVWPALQGPHNAQNVACAIAATKSLGLSDGEITSGLASFGGLPHRMERIAEVDGVLYVNDSKATNAASAAPALAAYPPSPNPRIHWIVGGLAKGEGIGECAPFLSHVAHTYLIGDATEMLARTLDGQLGFTRSGTLEAAVAAAHAAAKPGDIVLLSPAAASFDQYRDFEHRGDSFRALVAALTPQQETAR